MGLVHWAAEHYNECVSALVIYFTVVWFFETIVHEFAHLYAQRKCGIRVRFVRIGIRPALATFHLKDGVPVVLGIPLPIGGESRSVGEGDDYEAELHNPESLYYVSRHPKERVVSAAAGPLAGLAASCAMFIAYWAVCQITGYAPNLTALLVFILVWVNELANLCLPVVVPSFTRGKRWQRNDACIIYEGLWEWLRWKKAQKN